MIVPLGPRQTDNGKRRNTALQQVDDRNYLIFRHYNDAEVRVLNIDSVEIAVNQPAFSSSIGTVRSRFFTIVSVMTISLTFLLPGT